MINTSKRFYLKRSVKPSVLCHLNFPELERQQNLGRTRPHHASSSATHSPVCPCNSCRDACCSISWGPRKAEQSPQEWCGHRPTSLMQRKIPAEMTEANSKSVEVNESLVIALNGLGRSGFFSVMHVLKSSGFQTLLPLL